MPTDRTPALTVSSYLLVPQIPQGSCSAGCSSNTDEGPALRAHFSFRWS
jgi:hypothetical protein